MLAVAAPALLCAGGVAGAADDPLPRDAVELQLELVFSDRAAARVVAVHARRGTPCVALDDLLAAGIPAALLGPRGAPPVCLDAVPGLRYRYDAARQTLRLELPPDKLPAYRIRAPDAPIGVSPGHGLLVNYDLFASAGSGRTGVQMWTEQRAFGRWGVVRNAGTVALGHAGHRYRRLETRWSVTDPATMLTGVAGDTISADLPWTRAIRIGGLQLRRDFGARPEIVTQPLFEHRGLAMVPSTVELYVDGVRRLTEPVPTGPFVLTESPSLLGSGEAIIVVRDALGRADTVALPLYQSPALLAPGLVDFSIEAGRPRRGRGGYTDDVVGVATLRHGLSTRVTAEGHAEAGAGLRNGGVGAVALLGVGGVLHASFGASATGDGARGRQLTVGYDLRHGRFSAGVDFRRASRDYADLGSLHGAPSSMRTDRAQVALAGSSRNSMAISYVRLDGAAHGGRGAARLWTLSASATVRGRVSVFVNALHDAAAGGTGTSIQLGITTPLGPGANGTASVRTQSDAGIETRLSAQGDAPLSGGIGWAVQGVAGDGRDHVAARVRGLGRYGEWSAGVAGGRRDVHGHAGLRGALLWMDGAAHAGRPVADGFALVSTAGLADVPVLQENRLVGHTDRRGYLLVPGLQAFEANRLAVDPLAFPSERPVLEPALRLAPQRAGGALATFDAPALDAAWLLVRDPRGEPLAAGTRLRRARDGAAFVVGYDGHAFVTCTRDGDRLVADGAHACAVRVDRTSPGIGPQELVCR